MVDEPPVDVSDYLALINTAGQPELFALGDLAATPLGIDCLKVSAVVGTDDGGAASGRVFVNSGGTVADGQVAAVTQGY